MEKKKTAISNATLHRQKGGINLPHYKNTVCCETVNMPSPQRVVIPVRQHIGAPCEPIVAKGDLVKVGQKIADSSGFVSAPIHASVSGKVVAIENIVLPGSGATPSIVIESDGKMETFEGVKPIPVPKTAKELAKAIRESGLVGLGGAGFPAHVKIMPQENKPIETLIINFAECEPYVCSDYRLSVEETKDVFEGIEILQSVLHIPSVYICVEDNKPEAIKALQAAAKDEKFVYARDVRLAVLTSKYPKGAEKILINIVTGRQVPTGKLPSDVGALVMNLSSVAFIAKYFKTGMPLVSKRITVDGSAVKNPGTLRVPIGTLIKDIIEFCGGYSKPAYKLLMGGPMMGVALHTDQLPLLKQNNAILVLAEDKHLKASEASSCIKCGRCLRACPMSLVPAAISAHYENKDFEALQAFSVNTCIECGSCSYVCPAKRPLVQTMRLAKAILKGGQIRMSESLLTVTSSPHITSKTTTQRIMLDVIIALIPAFIASIIIFGINAVILTLTCVASCVLAEYISRKVMKRNNTISDLSAVVTGMLLAFNLPVTMPLWIAVVGSVVAIVVVKQMFGGIGKNIANPALVARIVLLVSFPVYMNNFAVPVIGSDAISAATPLAAGADSGVSLMNLFMGVRTGSLGETCIIALLIGGIYLIIRKVISPIIPVVYIGTVAVCYLIMGVDPLYYLMAGGLMLGAIFMATDYSTSPSTNWGKVIFAVGCGLITFLIRSFAALPEGVSYSIVIMNLLVAFIDRATMPKPFGGKNV